ncbi:MAG: hypothetical protein IJ006_03350, partial [Lachnospiraceae bacterium]|nr:hypothetical protein [Lachnospiraceae bacterium]
AAIFILVFGACSRPGSGGDVVPETTETPTVTVHPGEVTPMVSPSPVSTEVPTQIPSPSPVPTSIPSPSPVPTSTPSPTIVPTLTSTPSPVPTTRPTATPEHTKIPAPEAPVIVGEDGVLAENELCRVQLVSFGKEETDVVLRFLVENKSERDLIFSAQDVYVNRVINSFFEVEVPAGETAEERVLLFSLEQRLGITDISEVTEIFIPLEIYDARQVTYEAIWSGRGNMPWLEELSLCDWPCVIYPQGEESAVPFSYERQADDVVIAENEYFTMLLIDEVYEESGGYTAKLFVENHTEEPLFLEMEEYSLNGFRCEPYYGWETYLQGGTKAFGAIDWYGNRLEESEGDRVERLDFTLHASALSAGLFSEERYRVYPKGEDSYKEYSYIPGEQDVILYDGPECMLALTDFTTMTNWNEKKLVGTAYFVNRFEEELSFRIEGTAQVYMGDGKTDEWNMISADLWHKDVGGGEKQKLVLYLDAYPENPEDSVWEAAYRVKIGKGGEDFYDEWREVAVPMEAFEE